MSKPTSAASGEKVLLHCYVPAQDGPSLPGFGVYHTGIEVSDKGVELCYAGAPGVPGSGVHSQKPTISPDPTVWKFKETIDLGRTHKSKTDISKIMDELSRAWLASDYDVVHNNCNHFTAAVCDKLGDIKYPSHINRAARWGSFFMDNSIKDKARKKAKSKEEEEKKNNPFLATKGHSLSRVPSTTTSTSSASPASASGNTARVNPWRDPNFLPKNAIQPK